MQEDSHMKSAVGRGTGDTMKLLECVKLHAWEGEPNIFANIT